jgi:two-component system response regulator YesN
MNENVSFGVSSLCTDVVKLPIHYAQAVEILESKRFQGKTFFIAEACNEQKDEKILTLDIGLEQEISKSLHGKIDTAPDTIVRGIFDGFIEDGRTNEDIQMVLAELLNIVTREMREGNIPEGQIFQEGSLSYQTLHKFKNLPELKEWFAGIYERLDQFVKKSRFTSRYNENTKKSIDYMERNFCSRVTLGDIAKAVSVNSSYLSRLFKNDTGINAMDYLNKIRMENSARLIREGKASLKGIADEVGIQNYNHFFKLFKKYHGITPGEYKQKIEGDHPRDAFEKQVKNV